MKVNGYDLYGDLRDAADELSRHTTNVYDGLGRLTQVTHPAGAARALVDSYGYDVLGQRIAHSNNFAYGGYVYKETSDYDIQGRIVSQRALAAADGAGVSTGDLTTTGYAWSSSLATTGLDTFGGWTQTTTFQNGKTIVEASDGFDHVLSHTDMGGHAGTQSYDTAGRVVERAGTETQRYSYDNTGLVSQVSAGTNYGASFYETAHATYGYDKLGEKLTEYAISNGSAIENATVSYDALGRMATWSEAGSTAAPAATKNWAYDAVGNIRSNTETYHMLAADGTLLYNAYTFQGANWYRYDAMNRVVVTRGGLSNGQIGGTQITYDAAGEWTSATTSVSKTVTIANPNYDDSQLPKNGNTPNMQTTIYLQSLDRYFYNADGTLASVYTADGGYSDNGDGTVTTTAPTANPGNLKSTFSYDLLGRMTRQQDWTGNGAGVAYDRQLTFDGKGRVSAETDIQLRGSDTYTNYVTNDYHDGQYDYALGAAVYATTAGYKNGSYQQTSGTTTGYAWYDGAVQSTISYKPNTGQSTTYTTSYGYSGAGTLVSANVQDGRPRTVAIINNVLGQAVKRDESDTTTSQGDPHQIAYVFDGKTIGTLSNNGSTDNTGFETSLQLRAAAPGTTAFANGTLYGESIADFDQSYDAINSFQQGSSGGTYSVRAGDTLSSVAAQLWGDASLWYKLAQANGLTADGALSEGATLIVPAGVNRSGNSSSTFRPYDPSDAYGDTSPTTPRPQSAKKNKCGVFGQILVAIVSAAVTAIALPLGPVGAAVADDLAGQAFGNLIGVQNGFNFKEVALTAVTAGVVQGLGKLSDVAEKAAVVAKDAGKMIGTLTKVGVFLGGSGFTSSLVRGALTNTLSQGVGVAVGLQSKFSFAAVAAAGISSGVSSALSDALQFNPGLQGFHPGNSIRGLGANMAGDIAGAAARSLVEGSDFGDNVIAGLPDTLAQFAVGLGKGAVEKLSSGQAAGRVHSPTISPEKLSKVDGGLLAIGLAQPAQESDVDGTIHPRDLLSDETLADLRRSADIEEQANPTTDSTLSDTYAALRDALGLGEGGYESYNTGTQGVPGHRVGHSYLNPPAGTVTERSIADILATDRLPGTDPSRMFANGAYQITIPTLRDAVRVLGIDTNETLSVQMQDRIFRDYLVSRPIRDYINNGTGTADDAQLATARRWASVAVPAGYPIRNGTISNGQMSYYEGPANHASIRATRAVRNVLDSVHH